MNGKRKAVMGRIFTGLCLIMGIALSGCRENEKSREEFALYLAVEPVDMSRLPITNPNDLQRESLPLIASQDILTYDQNTHTLTLTREAIERLEQLDIPMRGKPFVVCVGEQPVYAGAFWSPLSSMSFEGIVIQWLSPLQEDTVRIQLSYPESPERFIGQDLRDDPRIIQALKEAGKLN